MKPKEGAALVLIVIASAWRHISSLRAPFFADDYLFLEQVRGRSLFQVLSSPDPIGNFLRPVGRQLYFWAVLHLGGESPGFFHAVNLCLFILALCLLFGLARKIAGPVAATVATSFVALHYAADVPLLWASGSQDLLALTGGIGALWLHLSGRRLWAAFAFALALLSKESVCLVPLVAIMAETKKDEPWRGVKRAWPLIAVAAVWSVVWIATVRLRPAAGSLMEPSLFALPAAMAHLVQVGIGAEFRAGMEQHFQSAKFLLPFALVLLAGGWMNRGVTESPSTSSRAVGLGVAWGVLGALPIAAVASIWSAYFYLFALCGVGLAVGAWAARRPGWLPVLLVAALALTSESARNLDEFATARGAWTLESHVNRFYVERAMNRVTRYLSDLRSAHATLPHKSTLFFANLPPSSGWQAADGPLVRWAYRDTSLRSYYLGSFSLDKTRRGPVFFFAVENDTLWDRSGDPNLLRSFAYSMILGRKAEPARDALQLSLERDAGDRESRYWLAWTQWALGDSASARASLALSGVTAADGPTSELGVAALAMERRDTVSAIGALLRGRSAHGLDVDVHSRLAALWLSRSETRPNGVVEAFAVTVLAPARADGWRKFAAGQLAEKQYEPAVESLQKYFLLGGAVAKQDAEAHQVMESVLKLIPGGALAQAGLREEAR